MVGFDGIKDFEARKRALTAESDVLRETLKLELRNFGLYGAVLRRRAAGLSALKPWLMLGIPVIRFVSGRKRRPRSGPFRLLGTALTAWRVYRRVGPFVKAVLSRPYGATSSSSPFLPRS